MQGKLGSGSKPDLMQVAEHNCILPGYPFFPSKDNKLVARATDLVSTRPSRQPPFRRPLCTGRINTILHSIAEFLVMCVHERWTYSECGCQIDHSVPCPAFLSSTSARAASPLRRMPKQSTLRYQYDSSPGKLPPSPSTTDSESEAQLEDYYRKAPSTRTCSTTHTLDKTFLEPICDDCLLEELGIERPSSNSLPPLDGQQAETLVWNSDVKIEVEPQEVGKGHNRHVSCATILESDVQIQIEDAVSDTLSEPGQVASPVPRQDSAFSGADADDEGSITVPRGRPRSRTKELRRHAMDVSREDLRLRISSRWPSIVKQDMQVFKDMLQGRSPSPTKPAVDTSGKTAFASETAPISAGEPPTKTALSRFTQAQSGGKTWAKNVIGDLKRSLSRSSRRGKKSTTRGISDIEIPQLPSTLATGSTIRTLRPVANESSTTLSQVATEPIYESHYTANYSSTSIATWQQHLSHDLSSRPNVRKTINRASQLRLDNPQPSIRRTSSVPNWLIPSRPFSDSQRRLLSNSTTPSIPTTARSLSSDIASEPHRLASLVSDSDFDTPPASWTYRPGPPLDSTRSSTQLYGEDEACPSPTIHDHRPPILSSAATTPPRPQGHLACHPLTTPLQTPSTQRPLLTPRSSSLRSPPLSAPMRLGSQKAPNGMSHSPTMRYACIWERKVCEKCGDALGETKVRSCICDGAMRSVTDCRDTGDELRVRCRATAPVVRYLTRCGEHDYGDDGQGGRDLYERCMEDVIDD